MTWRGDAAAIAFSVASERTAGARFSVGAGTSAAVGLGSALLSCFDESGFALGFFDDDDDEEEEAAAGLVALGLVSLGLAAGFAAVFEDTVEDAEAFASGFESDFDSAFDGTFDGAFGAIFGKRDGVAADATTRAFADFFAG